MTAGPGRTRDVYERTASFYDLIDLPFEYLRYRPLRRRLFQDLHGRILEAGVGTGRNVAYYPEGSEVIGIDLSPAMLGRAERRARSSSAAVRLIEMDLTSLAFPDGHFDAAVASFLFCTIPDPLQLPALAELARVVRTEGRVRLLDYIRPPRGARRAILKLWEPWARWAFAASFDRDPAQFLEQAGLRLLETRQFAGGLIRYLEAKRL